MGREGNSTMPAPLIDIARLKIRSDVPAHRQVAAYLKAVIALGQISPGDALPDTKGLAGQIAVANAAAVPETADDRLARRVEFELYSTRALPLQGVQVRSQDGTVSLTGPVTSRAEKLLAERVTQSVDGVKRVVNNLSAPEGAAAR